MTGMGDDGAQGLGLVKAAGGMTIAQNEESCVVYGMPKAGIERGFALRVVGLEMMANTLQVQCMSDRKRGLANGTRKQQGRNYGTRIDLRRMVRDSDRFWGLGSHIRRRSYGTVCISETK